MFFSSTLCSTAQPMFYKEALPSDKGIIYIPTAISSSCNLDFILCKHMTHMHWLVAFLKLGVRANSQLSVVWMSETTWRTEIHWLFPTSILTNNLTLLSDVNFLLLLILTNTEKSKEKNYVIIEQLRAFHFYSPSQPRFRISIFQ